MATWLVNSYGYPNPFETSRSARLAWEMFESFLAHPRYDAIKAFWKDHASRRVAAHGVESWKAAFEEFGLLYVLSGTDDVVITPGGRQLVNAAHTKDERLFAWIGLNLILRYPLRGKATRHSKGPEFDQSDLLLYWFLNAALVELDGFWHSELFRILSKVFRRADAQAAIDLVRQLRNGSEDIYRHPDPSDGKTGGVYNALNQVMVHGSLNHMLFTSVADDSPYFTDAHENRWHHLNKFRDLIELSLVVRLPPDSTTCSGLGTLIQRMPAAPYFSDEEKYFSYAGAAVVPLADAQAQAHGAAAPAVNYNEEPVFLLTADRHFTRISATDLSGPIRSLCVLAEGQRVLVSDELGFTYMVEHKQLVGDQVRIHLRRARLAHYRAAWYHMVNRAPGRHPAHRADRMWSSRRLCPPMRQGPRPDSVGGLFVCRGVGVSRARHDRREARR